MSNFEFIKKHQPVLSELGAWAEKYTYSDPQSAITKLRCFGELYVAFLYEVFTIPNEGAQTFFEKLTEPPRVSRRPNFLREYPNEKYLLT